MVSQFEEVKLVCFFFLACRFRHAANGGALRGFEPMKRKIVRVAQIFRERVVVKHRCSPSPK